jgi:tetratricopeptide (TPR) repeat protein
MEHLNAQLSQDFNDARFARFQVSNSVSVLVVLSHAQYLTGSLDAAAQTAQKILEYGRLASHELSLSNALAWNSLTHLLLGREEDCSRQAAMLDELIERHGIVNWRPVVTFCRGALAARRHPESPNGIDELKRAVAECRAIGHMARLPFYIAVLAQALAQQARFQEAEATIREAEGLAAVQNEKWCLPEILRIRAFIAQAQGEHRNAELLLQQSIAVAEEIGALTWQLRASNDLAVLWRAQSRTVEAKRLLKPVFDAFSEGFETHDLVAAAKLLAELK